jgi:hypothetical protein
MSLFKPSKLRMNKTKSKFGQASICFTVCKKSPLLPPWSSIFTQGVTGLPTLQGARIQTQHGTG